MFNQKLRSRNAKLLDVGEMHPNIKSSPGSKIDLLRIWNYLRKEGYTNFGTWEGPSASK
jgi:hypothetical protein